MRPWVREALAHGYAAPKCSRISTELDILRRALMLRKRGKLGVLWADGGKFWISESEFDPHGTRVMVTIGELAELVESIEDLDRKPAQRDSGLALVQISPKINQLRA